MNWRSWDGSYHERSPVDSGSPRTRMQSHYRSPRMRRWDMDHRSGRKKDGSEADENRGEGDYRQIGRYQRCHTHPSCELEGWRWWRGAAGHGWGGDDVVAGRNPQAGPREVRDIPYASTVLHWRDIWRRSPPRWLLLRTRMGIGLATTRRLLGQSLVGQKQRKVEEANDRVRLGRSGGGT